MKIINIMRILKPTLQADLNLAELNLLLGGKLYPGRPRMLVITMKNGRKVQIFRRGCIQVLGRITDEEAESMRLDLIERLRPYNDSFCELQKQLQITPFSIANIVVSAWLQTPFSTKNMSHSNACHFYEIEIFPAVLICKWKPAHIALFRNGEVIVTGVKSIAKCKEIISSLKDYLSSI